MVWDQVRLGQAVMSESVVHKITVMVVITLLFILSEDSQAVLPLPH